METKIFSLSDINPATYNPRKDLKPGNRQYEAIKHSIDTFGLVEPLVVNIRDGKNILVGGHQRYKILVARGDKEVDATIVDLDEEAEKTLNIALNKIEGAWDNEKLGDLLREIEQAEAVQIGFTQEELDDLLREINDEATKENGTQTSSDAQEAAESDVGDQSTAESENDENNAFEVYLSFPTEAAATEWLEQHGIERKLDSSRNIIIDFTKEAQEA